MGSRQLGAFKLQVLIGAVLGFLGAVSAFNGNILMTWFGTELI